jgi:DNA-binding NarL/FixJ family response regulator
VIVDIRLGDESGLALIRDAQAKSLAPAFLVLSSFDMPQYVDASLRFGAAGFLLKTSSPDEVFGAVKTIATGGLVFEPHLLAKGLAPRPKPLTAREREIVDGVLRGRSNDEIGLELGISRKTVEGHLSKLFGRFGIASRIELAIKAEREGWLDVP